jgi:hypothetical protein
MAAVTRNRVRIGCILAGREQQRHSEPEGHPRPAVSSNHFASFAMNVNFGSKLLLPRDHSAIVLRVTYMDSSSICKHAV